MSVFGTYYPVSYCCGPLRALPPPSCNRRKQILSWRPSCCSKLLDIFSLSFIKYSLAAWVHSGIDCLFVTLCAQRRVSSLITVACSPHAQRCRHLINSVLDHTSRYGISYGTIIRPHRTIFPPSNDSDHVYHHLDLTKVKLPHPLEGVISWSNKQILIRDEYTDMQNHLQKLSSTSGGVVVTGNSGIGTSSGYIVRRQILCGSFSFIGKSLFHIYILVDRLLLHQPTALQITPAFIVLFHRNGDQEIEHPAPETHFPPNTWALCNISATNTLLSTIHLESPNPMFVVQTAPSASKYWIEWRDSRRAELVIMKPWSLKEMIIAW
jgi:hypothetical protein